MHLLLLMFIVDAGLLSSLIYFTTYISQRYKQVALDEECFEELTKTKEAFGGTTSDVIQAALINMRHAIAQRNGTKT